jgi:hypothetical protein
MVPVCQAALAVLVYLQFRERQELLKVLIGPFVLEILMDRLGLFHLILPVNQAVPVDLEVPPVLGSLVLLAGQLGLADLSPLQLQ